MTVIPHLSASLRLGPERDPGNPDRGADLKTRPRAVAKRPPMYRIVMLNDDFTPMEFVVHVLKMFFNIPTARAYDIMMTVHTRGAAVVGVYTYEIAETKIAQVMDYARVHQHPLRCRMEKE
ncbi:ATP-dependent Clp protease adapter ClpS [Neomegalonema sp.]|uniref:ATP-dependent Clp protease adapter ClpS n=1 Tax=Neomegalonema sp. TaxID=2039713 RepID=UPI00262E2FFE|nr:ATP-dependent Clp protease adapter ClpS [Neomegalonema sp.]MDD2869000.1 ATP-dependent Clp protease adapter ClpS [Neomegalonema sp.]